MVLDTRWNRWFVIPIIHEVAMFHVFLVLRDVVITKKIAKNHWTSSRLQIKCGSWRSCVGHFLKCKCWPWGHYCSRRHIGVKISDGSGTWNWFKPSWTYMGFFYKKKKFKQLLQYFLMIFHNSAAAPPSLHMCIAHFEKSSNPSSKMKKNLNSSTT